MLMQNALDQSAKIGSDILAQHPVDSDIFTHSLDKLLGNATQDFVTQYLLSSPLSMYQCL